ncbi:MAG TPA: hypothetical protein VGC90_06495, partial [Candidatus Limnocylindrales bacterium]
MKSLFSRVQRELPDTDKDRYDIAYERGRAQSRSSLLFGGLALGALSGLIGMFILDPARGARRRADIAARVGGLRGQVASATRTASQKATDLAGKAKDTAADRGMSGPGASSPGPEPSFATGPLPASHVEPPTRAETVGAASTASTPPSASADSGAAVNAGADPGAQP